MLGKDDVMEAELNSSNGRRLEEGWNKGKKKLDVKLHWNWAKVLKGLNSSHKLKHITFTNI